MYVPPVVRSHFPNIGRVRVIRTWLVIALSVGGLIVPARASIALSPPQVGVNAHLMWTTMSSSERTTVLDRLQVAGADWVRVDVAWRSFEEDCKGCRAAWYIDRADAVVDAARAHRMKVLLMVHQTPGWANGGRAENVPPDRPGDFGDFMEWLARHFKDRVAAYEIWNEPDLDRFWSGSIAQYVDLLRAAYPRVKQGDSGARVVIAGTTYNNTPWLTRTLELGAGPYFDVVATHPYMGIADQPPETPDTAGDDIFVMDHVAAVHDLIPNKPIWFTEFGWSSHPNTGSEANWDRGVTEAQQADFLRRAVAFIANEHPYVGVMFWYNERDEGWSDDLQDRHYGLLYQDLSPKPAYTAFRDVAGGLGASTLLSDVAVRPVPVVERTKVVFRLGEAAVVSIAIEDAAGGTVRILRSGVRYSAGLQTVRWNRRDESGNDVPAGRYTAHVEATGTSLSDEADEPFAVAAKILLTRRGPSPDDVTVEVDTAVAWIDGTGDRYRLRLSDGRIVEIAPGRSAVRWFRNAGRVRYRAIGDRSFRGVIRVRPT